MWLSPCVVAVSTINGRSPNECSRARTSSWLSVRFCISEMTASYGAGLRACFLIAAVSAGVTSLFGCELMPHNLLKHE